MIKVFSGICMLLMVITTSAQHKQSLQKGKLFIIGGGAISDALRMQILNAGHWKKGNVIAAVTLASGYGDSAYTWMNDDFKKLTGKTVFALTLPLFTMCKKLKHLKRRPLFFWGAAIRNGLCA